MIWRDYGGEMQCAIAQCGDNFLNRDQECALRQAEADAAFIVEAVNNYDRLKASNAELRLALEEAAQRLDARGHKFGADHARAVLAKHSKEG